uniref:Uncharacterized protein n=1 Tax=Kalanchoe fedtschenkoi TaxID=63787 RepID=A0A7N0UM63_KALFE
MDVPQEVDEYIQQSMHHAVGLPVGVRTLELKLRASEEAQMRCREQYLKLGIRLKEMDEVIERTRAEASLNAQALKKFVEENRRLAGECKNLASQCAQWEKECSLYDRDREALMEFGNEADERAKEAESRAIELEEELGRVLKELHDFKARESAEGVLSTEDPLEEEKLLASVIETVICKDEVGPSAQAFLEANRKHDPFSKLHGIWNRLKPSSQMTISLIAKIKKLEKDTEHLRINLHTAEVEARLLSEENNILDEENKRLISQLKERRHSSSGGRHSCSSATKGQKRKSSPGTCSPIERLDFSEAELGRCPLSPLLHNSPDTRMHKK